VGDTERVRFLHVGGTRPADGDEGLAAFAAGAYERAVELLGAACRETSPAADPQLFIALARSLAASGDYANAVIELDGAARLVRPGTRAHTRLLLTLTAALCDAGRPGAAREALVQVELDPVNDLSMRARYLWASARIATFEHDPERALEIIDSAIAIYEQLDTPHDIGRLHQIAAETLNCQAGRHLLALERADLAIRHLAGADVQDVIGAATQRAMALAHLGKPHDALRLAGEALAQLSPETEAWEHGMARWAMGAALERLGSEGAHAEYLAAYQGIRTDTRYIPRLADAIVRTLPPGDAGQDVHDKPDARLLRLLHADRELPEALRVIRDQIDALSRMPDDGA
jgi:tetratricopeptide (TPR) repeat protein